MSSKVGKITGARHASIWSGLHIKDASEAKFQLQQWIHQEKLLFSPIPQQSRETTYFIVKSPIRGPMLRLFGYCTS
jgi:hypothetical protein